jgi:hypothetical protein
LLPDVRANAVNHQVAGHKNGAGHTGLREGHQKGENDDENICSHDRLLLRRAGNPLGLQMLAATAKHAVCVRDTSGHLFDQKRAGIINVQSIRRQRDLPEFFRQLFGSRNAANHAL